ncbi:MAG: type II 3-dehydroquinate dehydratase [Candidatus Cloacimonadota bacterium]|nr:type II 3-dehydroquinate dehydratase [Candidatus Cloacimonadota bacterium]
MKKNILIVNGPNLNFLGRKEMKLYGEQTLADLTALIYDWLRDRGWAGKFFQNNSEGAIIDFIQTNSEWADGMIINPAAYSHTSIAIYDCIKSVSFPAVEVHLSNIYHREEFRRNSLTGLACQKVIAGLGVQGYIEALENLAQILSY